MRTDSGSLAIGELLGAAGFITSVVAGSMAIVRPFRVAKKSFVRDLGFFVVAAGFSMVFLADGLLRLWECIVMIVFYFFYVLLIALWQWNSSRKQRFGHREAQARDHFLAPENANISVRGQEDDSAATVNVRQSRGSSFFDSFSDYERQADDLTADSDTSDTVQDRRWAEINTNMRLNRPVYRPRLTSNLIRPSLMGALEFRALLTSLERSRAQQSLPIYLRRYSDDPSLTLSQQQRNGGDELSSPNVDADMNRRGDSLSVPNLQYSGSRRRAASATDAEAGQSSSLLLTSKATQHVDTQREFGPKTPTALAKEDNIHNTVVLNPTTTSRRESGLVSDRMISRSSPRSSPPSQSPRHGPQIVVQPAPLTGDSEANEIRGISYLDTASSPTGAFPPYHDDPEYDTEPLQASPLSTSQNPEHDNFTDHIILRASPRKTVRWWPYNLLPPPQTLASTLFPTIYFWSNKNTSQKLLAIITCPSVFLLTITLPVVEPTRVAEGRTSDITGAVLDGGETALQQSEDMIESSPDHPISPEIGRDTAADLAGENEIAGSDHLSPVVGDWNRWLVIIQIVMAPFFVVVIAWANVDTTKSARKLLTWSAYAMLGSLVTLLGVILTTKANRPPRYRSLLCFIGFVVSIAWISTIANEVVGVLKAFGVILGISEAILGLTIFAVGNRCVLPFPSDLQHRLTICSLGDLVADVTVARLGFPVMALSACFGGPMLNILLGVGISGLYVTLQGGQDWQDRHPDRPPKYKPYRIEIGKTLIISGVTLLITLVGLLILVPLNKWLMDRKIGWGLVALWSTSTVLNVVFELNAKS